MVEQINPAIAASAYANTQASRPGVAAKGGADFGDFVKDIAQESLQTMRTGEQMSAKAVTGTANLTDVVEAVTSAELTLQTVVAVRDRMLSAYQEIMRMPI